MRSRLLVLTIRVPVTDDDLEDKFINEQYKNWKVWPMLMFVPLPCIWQLTLVSVHLFLPTVLSSLCLCVQVNSRFLYDVCLSHALEWPSLTVQMLPTPEGSDSKSQKERRLLLGTHTSENEQNYVLVVNVVLPGDEEEEETQEPATGQNWQREAASKGPKAKVEMVKRINHQGEVNRARYMPQKPSMIATKGPAAEVYVFDETKQPAKAPTDGACTPLLKLAGHSKEGYGICWNSMVAGRLVSASDDATICTWDVEVS